MNQLKKSQLVFISCLGFMAGIFIGSFLNTPFLFNNFELEIFLGFLMMLAGLICLNRKSLLWSVCLVVLFLLAGVWRYSLSLPRVDENFVAFYNDTKQVFRGTVIEEPDNRPAQTKLTLGDLQLQQGGFFKKIKGRLLLTANLYPEYHYGDRLQVDCPLQAPGLIEAEAGGKDFAYDKYLAKEKIYSLCYSPKSVAVIGSGQGSRLKNYILLFKDRATQAVSKALPEPHSSFLAGILWGARAGLPQEVMADFKTSGITHILAVSGYNISIIIVALNALALTAGLSRKKACIVSVVFIAAFAVLTGLSASVVRASLMGLLVLLIKNSGRLIIKHNLLALTMAIMLVVNPLILRDDVGFQLSFLAVIGLMYLAEPLEHKFKFLPPQLGLRETFSATLAATLATLPLMFLQFRQFSLVSLLVNLLVLPAIPLSMLFGFILLILALFFPPSAVFFSWLVWLPLTYVMQMAHWFSNFSWAMIKL